MKEDKPKRKTGQHGPYSVKSPNRVAALAKYRAEHNWSEEMKKMWAERRNHEAQSKTASDSNKKRWANWSEEKRQSVRDKISKGNKGRKHTPEAIANMTRANRIICAKRGDSVAEDMTKNKKNQAAVHKRMNELGVHADWEAIKRMGKDDVDKIMDILKKLPD